MKRVLLVLAAIRTLAFAEVPQTATYSGFLTDADDAPLTGAYDITVRVYATAEGGDAIFEELHDNATVTDGLFTIPLGEGLGDDPFDATLFDGNTLWLELEIDGTTLSPRSAVRSVPYAIRAGVADDAHALNGMLPEEFAGVAHGHEWLDLSDVPATFPPAAHSHAGAYLPVGTSVTCGAGQKMVGLDTSTGNVICAADDTPSGVIVYVAGVCPPGWSEYTAAQGRFVLGLPSAGTLEGTVATPLGNLATMEHSHTYTDVIAHMHAVDPPAGTTSSSGTHTHTLFGGDNSNARGAAMWSGVYSYARDGDPPLSSAGEHTHTLDIASFTSGSAGVATGATSSTGTTPPYIQLRACRKD